MFTYVIATLFKLLLTTDLTFEDSGAGTGVGRIDPDLGDMT